MEQTEDNDFLAKQFQNLEANDTEFTKKCVQVVTDIKLGTLTLLELIEHLKGFLINTAPSQREKGMVILSNVLEELPKDCILSEQLNIIATFYSDRLNDHHQVIPPALKGVLTLIQYKHLPPGATTQILTSLFQKVPCQQQQQSDRLIIYKIMQSSLEINKTEILQMGFDFVYGVISAMDGERDPRNLLFLFKWLPQFLKAVTLGHLVEEMFEVMACYFPVDFRAPSQDPDCISRDSLANSLCKCLCAVPQFAEFCLPLALEKLASALNIAKLDSLNLIIEGCKSFELHMYIQHSSDICSQIQREVFQGSDPELQDLALRTLETVLNKLSKSNSDIYKGILADIIDTLKGNLIPNAKLFTPSTKIIHSTAKSSGAASSYVIHEIVPLLTNTFNITSTTSHQAILLETLIDLVQIYTNTHNNRNIVDVNALSTVPNLCLKAILQTDSEVSSAGLRCCAALSESLPVEIRKHLYDYLCMCLVTPSCNPVREAALQCFRALAQNFSAEVQQYVVDKIQLEDNVALALYLDSLIVVANLMDFMDIVLSTIIQHCFNDIETMEITTATVKKLLETYGENVEIYNRLVVDKKIISETLNWFSRDISVFDTSKHKNLLENIAAIFKTLVGYVTADVQVTIFDSSLDNLISIYKSSSNPAVFIILEGLLTRSRMDSEVSCDVTEVLLDYCIESKEEYICCVCFMLLANILNKDTNEQRLQNRLSKISNTCNCAIAQNNQTSKANAINLISWVAKALVTRGHTDAQTWTSKLLDLIDYYAEVAKTFQIFMCDSYDCLSNRSYCNKRILYQQKFFIETTNALSEKYSGENHNCLLAMGYLLPNAPKQVFMLQFNKILRLVVMCLEHCHDEYVLCALLEALQDLIKTKESLMEQHMQEFLPRFLKLATFEKSMQVRIKALQCIQNYAIDFPVYKLLLQKQEVLQGLSQCLDDKKRLVRKEAVEARNRWYLMDAPI